MSALILEYSLTALRTDRATSENEGQDAALERLWLSDRVPFGSPFDLSPYGLKHSIDILAEFRGLARTPLPVPIDSAVNDCLDCWVAAPPQQTR